MDLAEKGFHALSVAERIMSTFIVYYWKASYSKMPLKVRIESFPPRHEDLPNYRLQ